MAPPLSASSGASRGKEAVPPKSPFFQPSTPFQVKEIQTPGGSRHTQKVPKKEVEEHKSSIFGCSANLINAIVGSGIVGIPFAIQQAGFCTGLLLVVLCATLTEKSLRILIETAKHVEVPTYETLCEAAFGRFGFLFISLNMFFLAYGAMTSYLMIIKDTFGRVLGLEQINQRRALLFCISLLVIVPLSSLRDMADLAQTSRFNVLFDICMVLIVVWVAPVSEQVQDHGGVWPVISNGIWPHWNTVFVGLGVLSFAFVCQHSAFIIAGSLQQPTRRRWKQVTRLALLSCVILAVLCGTCGYLGYLDQTEGNILNNLNSNHILSNIARSILGTTMLFVYPMESFVARHVCVVLLFQGRRAHEGEDSAVLSRRDRRITLTVALYLMALLPAMLFENLGKVFAATGAVGGSCLSYIGVGAVYIGVYGANFLQLIEPWQRDVIMSWKDFRSYCCCGKMSKLTIDTTLENKAAPTVVVVNDEVVPLKDDTALPSISEHQSQTIPEPQLPASTPWWIVAIKTIGWYLSGMPLWFALATIGKHNLIAHRLNMAGKSPHISRIDSRIMDVTSRRLQKYALDDFADEDGYASLQQYHGTSLREKAASLHGVAGTSKIVIRSDSGVVPAGSGPILPPKSSLLASSYQQPQQQQQEQNAALKQHQQQQLKPSAKKTEAETKPPEHEDDPPPTYLDFVVAIGYILFGVVALVVGLLSLAYAPS